MATSKYRRAELEFDTDEVDLDGFGASLAANSGPTASGDLSIGSIQMAASENSANLARSAADPAAFDNLTSEARTFHNSSSEDATHNLGNTSVRMITPQGDRWKSAGSCARVSSWFKQKWTNREKCLALLAICLLIVIFLLLFLLGSASTRMQSRTLELRSIIMPPNCTSAVCIEASSRILSAYDATIDRCTDFYTYSCGNYVRTTFILPGNAEWNRFSELQQNILVECYSLIEQLDSDALNATISRYTATKGDSAVSDVSKTTEEYQSALLKKNIKTFMRACMNRDRIDALRGEPLLRAMERLGGWRLLSFGLPNETSRLANDSLFPNGKTNIEQLLSELHKMQAAPFFTFTFGEDAKNSSFFVLSLDQSGIRLPSREYYLQNVSNFVEIRAAYKRLIINVIRLLRADYRSLFAPLESTQVDSCETQAAIEARIDQHADWIIRIETALADAMLNAEERRDDLRVYNRYTFSQFVDAVRNGSLADEATSGWPRVGNSTKNDFSREANWLLANSTMGFNWQSFFDESIRVAIDGVRLAPDEPLVVASLRYYERVAAVLRALFDPSSGLSEFGESYAFWQLTGDMMGLLAGDYRETANRFRAVLLGIEGVEPTWKDCVELLDSSTLGNALSALYVRAALGNDQPSTSDDSFNITGSSTLVRSIVLVERMTHAIRSEFERSMSASFWLDPPTARAAINKLNSIKFRLGFPHYLLNTSTLVTELNGLDLLNGLNDDTHYDNLMQLMRVSFIREMRRFERRRIDRSKWDMTPITVNAYYSPTANEIVIPAGILRPPFFSPDLPSALNYGALGVVIGHELQHAFDDEGSQFDAAGNLNEGWWSNVTRRAFEGVLDCFARQYDDFMTSQDANAAAAPIANTTVNANSSSNATETRLTLGENLADSGGLIHAYRAFERLGAGTATGDFWPIGLDTIANGTRQLFFVGFAGMWCAKSTRENNLMRRFVAAHSSAQYRVLGTLRNSAAFRTHFGCNTPTAKASTSMTGCRLWPLASDTMSDFS